MPLTIGATFERYTIEAFLGAGGMGEVYRAFDPRLHRRVALKVLRASTEDDGDTARAAATRMLREARAAAALDHPNAVAVFDCGDHEGTPFIAMELVTGRSLRQLMGHKDAPTPQRLRWLVDVARALAAAHGLGLVHRDVKPENVMVRADGVVKVLDFGIARRVQPPVDARAATAAADAAATATLTAQGAVIGTPAYMAPEQLRGQDVDARADQFAWGVVAYELLAGAFPWGERDALARALAVLSEEPPPLAERCPDLPPGVAPVVTRALAKSPARRFPSMHALLEALAPLCPAATPAPPPGLVEAPAAPAALSPAPPVAALATPATAPAPRRRRRAALLTALLAAAAAAVSTAGVIAARGDRAPLAQPDSVLACPILRASGVEEPSGWLGAATASLACERAAIMLGGRDERTLIPAELLDLPRVPTDSFPRDPFGAPDARERSVRAARARAAAWLDGVVTHQSTGFRLTLILRNRNGAAVARGEGSGVGLRQAVRGALEALGAARAVPAVATLDPRIARWTRVVEVDALLARWDVEGTWGAISDALRAAECERSVKWRRAIGPVWERVCGGTAAATAGAPATRPTPAVDHSSAEAFARSVDLDSAQERRALAAEAARWRATVTDPVGRRQLTNLEVLLAFAAGDTQDARQLALGLLQEFPRAADARIYEQVAAYGGAGFGPGGRALAAWLPCYADAWNHIAVDDALPAAARLSYARRAAILSNESLVFAVFLAEALVDAGAREEARALAARLEAAGPGGHLGAETVLARVEWSEGRLGAALTRLTSALASVEEIGHLDRDLLLVRLLVELATILDRRDVLDGVFRRFLAPEPPRVTGFYVYATVVFPDLCVAASPGVSGPCVARLQELIGRGYFTSGLAPGTEELLAAMAHLLRGDRQAALLAARRVSHRDSLMLSGLFDQAGDADFAQRLDDRALAHHQRFPNDSTPAALRSARRAAARGDPAAARRFAQQVIDAWGGADVQVPAVAQLRALLQRLPPATQAAR